MTVGISPLPDGVAPVGCNAWGMAGTNEANTLNVPYTGSQMPFPPISPSLCPFTSSSSFPEPQDHKQIAVEGHQRFSSESMLDEEEEQPSWLDELLNEPEVVVLPQVHKGHRRWASDSSAYLDAAVETFNMREEFKFPNPSVHSPWSSQNFVHPSFDASSFSQQYVRDNERSPLNYSNSFVGENKHDQVECGEISDCAEAKISASKAEAKRAKQQSARRSRVRKLQYIAELERNLQVLQAEESLGAAKFGFLDQQNLILVMENRALRQRLENLSQEQRIKQFEQEMLERELVRLRIVYQLQQQKPQQQQRQHQKHQLKHHRRSKSHSDFAFANHSPKNKEASSSNGTLKDFQSHFASLSLRRDGASSSCGSVDGSFCM